MLMKKGTRCTICTGCGRCYGEYELKPHILSLNVQKDIPDIPGEDLLILADIGTTTIAMVLADTDGNVYSSFPVINPQAKYGADVISRIRASADISVLNEMKDMVWAELDRGVRAFERLIPEKIRKIRMFVAANTTMVYLLCGLDPSELGHAPFTASHLQERTFCRKFSDFELQVTVLPGLSAFVGADIYSGILACDLQASDKYRLLCDLGTNGEIALGNKDHLYVTATAAGPAFEGGPAKGIWGSDMISLTAALLRENILDKTGLLKDPWFEEGISIGNVYITQDSVRALQLAKAAMHAGIVTICSRAGIGFEDIEECILAGGFGYFLSPEDAAMTGLLPDKLKSGCRAGGNTALSGMIPYSRGMRINTPCEVINLAEDPSFNGLYMSAVNFEKF